MNGLYQKNGTMEFLWANGPVAGYTLIDHSVVVFVETDGVAGRQKIDFDSAKFTLVEVKTKLLELLDDSSKTVISPYIDPRWIVAAFGLAKDQMEAVRIVGKIATVS